MKITEKEKAENRAAIVDRAGELFRERGLRDVAIADLMREAGFTHGGFYNHFPSKDALAAEVCATALARASARFADAMAGPDPDGAWRRYVEGYLSPDHRDDPGAGCTVAALMGDAAHAAAPVQAALASGSEALLQVIAAYFARRYRLDADAARRRAVEAWTQMVGALSLSRATVLADRALSDEVLAVARDRLTR